MNFALFLLLNAVLFIRPEELFPGGPGLHVYLIVILFCAAANLPRLIELLSPSSLRTRPVAVCVLMFFAASVISLCARGRVAEALFEFGPEFAKVILFYFLLLAAVDTPGRFRAYVAAIVVLVGALTTIALAQHYGVAEFPNIIPAVQTEFDPKTGEPFILSRLVSTGIFNDPNDLCLVLGLGILGCIYGATSSPLGIVGRVLWLLPVPLFIHALFETHSRGGLLGVLAGGAAYLYSRFGGPRALPFALIGAAAAFAVVGGRQGSLEGGGTAHERVMAWAEGLTELFRHPLYVPTGLGQDWYADETGRVAHNSFVQAYVENGLLGGGAFLGAFYLGARILDRLGRGVDAPRWAVEARHFGFAALVGYAAGCYSITRNFVVPTYLTLGLASVLIDQAGPRLPGKYWVTGRWFLWLGVFSVCGLLLITLATQALGRAGI